MRRVLAVVAVMALWSCGGHGDKPSGSGGETRGGSANVVGSDMLAGSAGFGAGGAGSGAPLAPVALGSDGLPVPCAEWHAALDKLATCDAIPPNARDSLKAVYADVSKDWGQLPADAKKRLGPICQAGADSVLKGAKATCGW